MLTIKQSMELAGRNLLHCLRPEDQFRPLWGVDIEPDLRAKCRRSRFEHNVGRWWDAVLRLEAATGFEIPAEMEAGHVAESERLPRTIRCPFVRRWIPRQVASTVTRSGRSCWPSQLWCAGATTIGRRKQAIA